MKSVRSLITLVAALCLIGAQQAAFAHWAAHLGAPARIALDSPDQEHGNAASLSQFCAGCAAFAAVDAALPSTSAMPEFESVARIALLPAANATHAVAIRHFDPRAPPAVL